MVLGWADEGAMAAGAGRSRCLSVGSIWAAMAVTGPQAFQLEPSPIDGGLVPHGRESVVGRGAEPLPARTVLRSSSTRERLLRGWPKVALSWPPLIPMPTAPMRMLIWMDHGDHADAVDASRQAQAGQLLDATLGRQLSDGAARRLPEPAWTSRRCGGGRVPTQAAIIGAKTA